MLCSGCNLDRYIDVLVPFFKNNYKILSLNSLLIHKKTSKIIDTNTDKLTENIPLNSDEKYMIKNNFTKLIYLQCKYNIDKISGYKLFKILLKTFKYLDVNNYSCTELSNIYL